jgi:multicomponent Na+:H+ antiporter subunit D
VLGALCQWEMRRILSWHIISQVGYMVMGIGLAADPRFAVAAVAATIFYVVHHIIVKSSLFLVGGIAEHITGTQKLKAMGGLLETEPVAAGIFLIAALSLAGMPPFSGFLAKFVVLRVGLSEARFGIVAIAVVTSFLTLMSMMKIWSYAFWARVDRVRERQSWWGLGASTAVLVVATVILGLFAQPFLRLAEDAAVEVTRPTAYVEAVLGSRMALAAAIANRQDAAP